MQMNKIILQLKSKIPAWGKIIPVYAVITLFVYGWSLYCFLYEYSGWAHYLTLSEITALYTYVLMINFMESLLILFFVFICCILLPREMIFVEFIYRGAALSLFVIAYLFALILSRTQLLKFPPSMINLFPLIAFIALLLIIFGERFTFPKKMVEDFADRTTIFLYLSIPASAAAVIAIIIRSVF